MLAAVQSPEVPEEHQHDRPVAPEVAEAMVLAGRVGERDVRECGEIHGRQLTAGRSAAAADLPAHESRGLRERRS